MEVTTRRQPLVWRKRWLVLLLAAAARGEGVEVLLCVGTAASLAAQEAMPLLFSLHCFCCC